MCILYILIHFESKDSGSKESKDYFKQNQSFV